MGSQATSIRALDPSGVLPRLDKPILDGRRCGKGLKNFKMPLSAACPEPLS
jgi:hypothetical protein